MKKLAITIRRSDLARKFVYRIAVFFILLFAFVSSNSDAQTVNWRDDIGVLRVGYLIDGNQEVQRQRLEPFRSALRKATGLPVFFNPVASLDQLISLQANRRIQYAIHSASSFATTEVICKCLEILAVPSDSAGAKGVHAVLLAPADGAVRSLNDLHGKKLAIPAAPATTTRAVPLAQLSSAGFANDGALGTLVDVTNPIEGWRLIKAGQADSVMGWSSLQGDMDIGYSSGTLRHLIDTLREARRDDIRIVWQSRFVPYGPHAIRKDLPTPLKEILRAFLLDLKNLNLDAYEAVEPSLSGGFVRIERNAFTPLMQLAQPTDE